VNLLTEIHLNLIVKFTLIWKALHEQLLTLENLKAQGPNKYVIFLGKCFAIE
jgi:hypothetical protein